VGQRDLETEICKDKEVERQSIERFRDRHIGKRGAKWDKRKRWSEMVGWIGGETERWKDKEIDKWKN